jgi:D-aminopeptidase
MKTMIAADMEGMSGATRRDHVTPGRIRAWQACGSTAKLAFRAAIAPAKG